MPRIYKNRGIIETQEHQVGQDGVRQINENHELPQIKTEQVDGEGLGGVIEKAGRHQQFNADGKLISDPTRGKKWIDEMAFMEELVTVIVHESTDKLAHPFPEVTVNNRVQRFVRGHEQQVKRKFLERLARAKLTTYDNQKTKDVDGEDTYRYPTHTALQFPFAVIGDSEKGKAWLKKVLAEA